MTEPNAAPEEGAVTGWFVNIRSGALGRILSVDDSFAQLAIISPAPSRYAIPIAEYNGNWADSWRPATLADLPPPSAEYRPPRSITNPDLGMPPGGDPE